MDETMVQDETMNDVIETDAEIIDTDDDSDSNINPVAVGVGVALAAVVGFGIAKRNDIAAWWDKRQEQKYQKWCEKTGRSYVMVEDSNTEQDKEN